MPSHSPDFVPSANMLRLIGSCVARLTDVVVITEAEPLDLPGPRIVFVNDAFVSQTGYSREEVIGKSPRILQGPLTDQIELRRLRQALERWESVRTELVNYAKDGTTFTVEMDIVPIPDERGWYTHWVAIQRDVTSRKHAEAEAATRELQRTDSIGTLALGIAHDFNNIIAAIVGNVVLGRQDIDDGRGAGRALDQIDVAAARARGLVQQIVGYGRRQPQLLVRQPLTLLILDSVKLLRAVLPVEVSLNVELEEGALEVLVDSGQLNQVLLNLGTNAWHAFRGAPGKIDIRLTSLLQPGEGLGAPTAFAVLEVRDSGSGMDDATLARLFDPYFTTKAVGKGTGLGLSVVWNIVKAHSATISVVSELGKGSIFKIVFPVPDRQLLSWTTPRGIALQRGPAHTRGANRRVLLVDDDEVTLLVLEAILSSAGFQVVSLTDPCAAVALISERPRDFDVVVTDLNMPGMSGLELTRQLLSFQPNLAVAIGSGHVRDELYADALEAGVVAVFRKESAPKELVQILCDLLTHADERKRRRDALGAFEEVPLVQARQRP